MRKSRFGELETKRKILIISEDYDKTILIFKLRKANHNQSHKLTQGVKVRIYHGCRCFNTQIHAQSKLISCYSEKEIP